MNPVLGSYRIEHLLGRGGGGEVWKAWDERVGRWVALKILRDTDDATIARFKREATLAASLDHPNIAAIYEVGEDSGRHFIAMQFVDGHPLRADSTKLRDHAAAVRTAALAIHAAHERGIVHRDLKPDNLMIDGSGRVYVMDFGLAKLASVDSSLSQSGFAIGTPAYMPPEQARGEIHAADARSDVYSLGATLFALATGRAPFDGSSALEILIQVVGDDPVAPRSLCPAMDADLETIILKCLEKDPARRYASAKALADDLDRWLAGDSISGRRPSLAFRLSRLARRRGTLLAIAAVSLVVIVAAFLVFRRSKSGAAEADDALIHRMREVSDLHLSAALDLRRAGDVAGMMRHADEVRRACDAVNVRRPDLAEPHYRDGRMLRALMRDAEALTRQDAALRLDPGYAPSLYERVILRSRAALARINELAAADTRASLLHALLNSDKIFARAIVSRTRGFAESDPAIRELVRLLEADLDALERRAGELPAAHLACARAHGAWIQGNPQKALDLLKESIASIPPIEEAWRAAAEILLLGGRARDSFALWDKAVEGDRGYLPHREGRARARRDARDFAGAVDDLGVVLEREPGRLAALVLRGDVHLSWSLAPGAPPGSAEAAVADYTAALAIDDRASDSWVRRAVANSRAAARLVAEDRDPMALYAAAIRDFDEAARLAPDRLDIVRLRSTSLLAASNVRVSMLREPGPELVRAKTDLERLIALAPSAELFALRGQVGITEGLHLINLVADGRVSLIAAVRDYDEAMRLDPSDDHRVGRAHALSLCGTTHNDLNLDPTAYYRRAVEDFDALLKTEPPPAGILNTRAELRVNWGKWVARTSGNPRPYFESAIADCTRGLTLSNHPGLNGTRATAWQQIAIFEAEEEQDCLPALKSSEKDYTIAIAGLPARIDLRENRAIVRGLLATRMTMLGEDPEEVGKGAIEDFDAALKVRPKKSTTWARRGFALQTLAGFRLSRGRPAEDAFRAAIDSYSRAIELDPAKKAELAQHIATCRMFVKP